VLVETNLFSSKRICLLREQNCFPQNKIIFPELKLFSTKTNCSCENNLAFSENNFVLGETNLSSTTTVSRGSGGHESVAGVRCVDSPSRLFVVAERAARQPPRGDTRKGETDGGDGVGKVPLRPLNGAYRDDLALGPRGKRS